MDEATNLPSQAAEPSAAASAAATTRLETAADVPFAGVWMQLARRRVLLPPLSFAGFRDTAEHHHAIQAAVASQSADGFRDGIVNVVHVALRRNYPDIERTEVEDALDWANATETYSRLMAISVPGGASGETPVASPSGASTGTGSSLHSPQR